MNKFGESGIPVFRVTNPLSRGTLERQKRWKIIDTLLCRWDTIWNCFSHILGNQFSIYGAVSDMCEEYSVGQARTVTSMIKKMWPIVRVNKIVDNNSYTFDWNPCNLIAKEQKTSGKTLTTRSCGQNLYNISWQNTLTRPKLGPCWKSQRETADKFLIRGF